MTRLIVAGIDASLASTGIAVATLTDGMLEPLTRKVVTTGHNGATVLQRAARLDRITGHILDTVPAAAALVVIEGPSYASPKEVAGQRHDRSGLWWQVVHALLAADLPVTEVAPTSRAKYATGSGAAGKDAVLAAAVKRYPAWDITGNDVADAVIVAAMGCRHLGHPIDSLPQVHLAAMTKVHWPATESGASA